LKIALIGAGVAGVATAYELAALQHQVTVFERRSSVATEGSYALAGLLADCSPLPDEVAGTLPVSQGTGAAWDSCAPSTPRTPWMSGLLLLPWLLRQWRSRRGPLRARQLQALTLLTKASRERVNALALQHQLAYEQEAGVLLLWPHAPKHLHRGQAVDGAAPWLDSDGARVLQPDLAPGWPLKVALGLPGGQVGNARLFTQGLKAHAQRMGVEFVFDTEVCALAHHGQTLQPICKPGPTTAQADAGVYDAVVVCAGIGSQALLRSAGLRLPLTRTTAYALTAPLQHLDGLGMPGPRGAVVDVQSGLVISRLGQRVRVTGLRTLGRGPRQAPAAISRRLHAAMEAAFPGCAVVREARVWQGEQLCTPDGGPLLGPAGLPGLWLNLGHGAHDWALASGAARMLALQMSRVEVPEVLQAFAPGRWR
jgi:D-amino-acid dehydrogenase